MTKAAWDKARTKDKNSYNERWEELKQLLKVHYPIKMEGERELFIDLEKGNNIDIEVFPHDEGYYVGLWYESIPEERAYEFQTAYNFADVIDRIDTIKQSVKNKYWYIERELQPPSFEVITGESTGDLLRNITNYVASKKDITVINIRFQTIYRSYKYDYLAIVYYNHLNGLTTL